jgi:hypothetical protein
MRRSSPKMLPTGSPSPFKPGLMRWSFCVFTIVKDRAMLTPDFKEFAELLNSNKVEYLIVGGYALAAYGHPRYTGDLDFWVGSAPDNADRVLEALDQFGFGSLGIKKEDLVEPNQVLQLGFPPARIDLLTSIDGVAFGDCYTRRMLVEVDGMQLAFIALNDFKINKRAVGRHQDFADLESLDIPVKP